MDNTIIKNNYEIPNHATNYDRIMINADLKYLTKSFSSDMYYGRTLLSEDGKKAWDISLQELLEFDNTDNKYKERDSECNVIVPIDYEKYNIKPTVKDANDIQRYLVRNESRMFHLKDWGADIIQTGGIVTKQKFHIGNGCSQNDSYHNALMKTESKTSEILNNIELNMTLYQQIQSIQKAYEASVTYSNTGSPGDIRGALTAGKAICGGYSKGFMYLMHRIGVPTIWIEGQAGGYHAWNYLLVEGNWFLMDTTWGGKNWYLRGSEDTSNHKPNNTFNPLPKLVEKSLPYLWGNFPSILLNVKEKEVLALGSQYDELARDRVQYTSIYGEDLSNYWIVQSNVDTSKVGLYNTKYTLSDMHGNSSTKTSIIQVMDGQWEYIYDMLPVSSSGNILKKEKIGLYLNGVEDYHDKSIAGYEKSSMTFDISQRKYTYFSAYIGILDSVRQNVNYGMYGKVEFQVLFDESLVFTSERLQNVSPNYISKVFGWKDNEGYIFLEIPDGIKTITIVNVNKGAGNNHGGWGSPKLI